MDYVYWLIEHPDNGKRIPFYYGWAEGERGWTPDIKDAFKLSSEAEAEKMASDMGLPDYRILDHKFLDHEPTTNLDIS